MENPSPAPNFLTFLLHYEHLSNRLFYLLSSSKGLQASGPKSIHKLLINIYNCRLDGV